MLGSTLAKYKVNRMAIVLYYQTALQKYMASLFFFLCIWVYCWLLFCIWLTVEGEGETPVRSVEESSQRKCSSLVMSTGRAEEVMKDFLIIIDVFFALEGFVPIETIAGVRTLAKKVVGGNHTSSTRVKHNWLLLKWLQALLSILRRWWFPPL